MGRLRRAWRSLAYGVLRRIRNAGLIGLALVAPAHAEETVIAALGDSLTQGYGLAPPNGFVPQLQAWLQANGQDVRVINAGVSGDTTAGGLCRVDWTLTDDVDAMIVALGGNDLLRGIDPAASRANLTGILDAAAEKGVDVLLVGMEAPGNYGPDYKRDFDRMYPDLAAAYDTLLYPTFFEALTANVDQAEAIRLYMQADGIHPNPDGVAIIVKAMGPSVLSLIAATKLARQ